MALIIVFFAAGLFAYWLLRFWLLAFGEEAVVEEILDGDLSLLRLVRLLLRILFVPLRVTM
jgi:hypothetical protein